jgi:hypothetical protein
MLGKIRLKKGSLKNHEASLFPLIAITTLLKPADTRVSRLLNLPKVYAGKTQKSKNQLRNNRAAL